MKSCLIWLFFLLTFLLWAELPPYPANTYKIESAFQTNLILSPWIEESGGSIDLKIYAGEINNRFGTALLGGYSWYPADGQTMYSIPQVSLLMLYDWTLWDSIRVQPQLGGGILWPWGTSNEDPHGQIRAGVELGLHLYDRNFLQLTVSYTQPIHPDLQPWFTLGIGYGRSHRNKVPLPPMGMGIIISGKPFSPDGDGENDLYPISIFVDNPASVREWVIEITDPEGVLFYQTSGQGAPPRHFQWNGRSSQGEWVSSAVDYELHVELSDLLGNKEDYDNVLRTDILVVKDGDKLKIRIPSIMFAPDSSDLVLLNEPEITGNNKEILKRLYEIFQKFPDYKIQIEGHANNMITHSEEARQREQDQVLVPLSLSRAESVKEGLVELGIEDERISCTGIGGAVPLFPIEDRANLWKNRRVEFILLK